MMRMMQSLLVMLCLCAGLGVMSPMASAQTDTNAAPLVFRDAHEESRFHALSSELRCVMCQNQSLADSNAVIARDLRVEVLGLMRKGMTDAEIKTFLVQRYGEFVLYKPRMAGMNMLLWFGPLLLAVGGAVVLFGFVRKRKTVVPHSDTRVPEEEEEW